MAEKKRRTIEAPEVRRAQLLDAAKICFRERGFHATRMADIAERAGLSVGLVYRYFPGKQSVIEAIIRDDLTEQRRFFEQLFEAHPNDPLAAIESGASGYTKAIMNVDRTALMLEIASETVRNPQLAACDPDASEKLLDLFLSHLNTAGLRPMAKEEIEVRLQLLGALISGVAIQLAMNTHKPSPALFKLMEETARHLLLPDAR